MDRKVGGGRGKTGRCGHWREAGRRRPITRAHVRGCHWRAGRRCGLLGQEAAGWCGGCQSVCQSVMLAMRTPFVKHRTAQYVLYMYTSTENKTNPDHKRGTAVGMHMAILCTTPPIRARMESTQSRARPRDTMISSSSCWH